jgi:hypothetical protein
VKRVAPRPVLITDAERSQHDQLRSRTIRYVVMMSLRALCLVLAGVLVGVGAPMLWLWLPLCGLGMVLLPWFAVILANDRLPKDQHRLSRIVHRQQRTETPPGALPAARSDDDRTIEADIGPPTEPHNNGSRPGLQDGRDGRDGRAPTTPTA